MLDRGRENAGARITNKTTMTATPVFTHIRDIAIAARLQMKEAWVDGARKEKEIGGYAEIDDTTVHMIEVLGEGEEHACHFDRFFENLFHTHRPASQTALRKNPPSGNDFVGALTWGGLSNEFNPKFRLRTLHDVVVDEEGIWIIAKPLCKPPFRADGSQTPPDIIDVLDAQSSKEARRRFLEAIGFATTVYAILYASDKIDRQQFVASVSNIDVPATLRRIDANPPFRNYLVDQAARNGWACTYGAVSQWAADEQEARKIQWPIRAFRIQFEPWVNDELAKALTTPVNETPRDDDDGGNESNGGSG